MKKKLNLAALLLAAALLGACGGQKQDAADTVAQTESAETENAEQKSSIDLADGVYTAGDQAGTDTLYLYSEDLDVEGTAQIHVVDSWSCSLNMVMELRLANHLLEAGAGIRTILDELYAVREKVRTYYLIDNLEFLIKGGRVSPLKGGIAAKLRIKPIVAIKNGEGSIPANAMGYQNGLSKLAHFFWEDCTPDSELYVSHAGCPEKAMAIVEKIRERYHNLKYYIYPMLGTMSTQSGPDSIGIFYTKNK